MSSNTFASRVSGPGPPGSGSGPAPTAPWSPSSAASEDTQVTLPGGPERPELSEEESLRLALTSHDDIRFASYRTAAKLRSLQKHTYLHHIDIWNMMEAFREHGLQEVDHAAKITPARVQALLDTLYDGLQKRLPISTGSSGPQPPSGQILRAKSGLLLSFLWQIMNPAGEKCKIRPLKTALATLSTGKLMDKLRYIFSQLCDSNGCLIHSKFQQFLNDISKIPGGVNENLNSSGRVELIFEEDSRVTVNDFLESMMSDPGPQCLSWLLVLHRVINAEGIHHPVSCGSCRVQGFHGLRYKSDRGQYHLCQNCFWRGKISPDHADDVFKEYNNFKSTQKRGGANNAQEKRNKSHYDCESTETSNGYPSRMVYEGPSFSSEPTLPSVTLEDEHSLIAQYASQLTLGGSQVVGSRSRRDKGKKALHQSRQLVQDLEKKNREIMHDINALRKSHKSSGGNAHLLNELSDLRSHKDELEGRLNELQATRQELMTELGELMKLLQPQKQQQPQQQQGKVMDFYDASSKPHVYQT